MNARKLISLGCLLIMMALFVGGCGDAKSTPAAAKKTSLVYGISMEPNTLDPQGTSDMIAHMAIRQIYDGLVAPTPGNMNTPRPALAESYEVNQAGNEYTFKIRKGVKFHNGAEMTMEDVDFSMQRAMKSSYLKTFIAAIDHFEVVDGDHIKMVLKYPYKPILQILTNSTFSIVCKKVVESVEASGGTYGREPVGTGPYKFVSWSKGDKIVLKANDSYFRGAAAIKDLTMKIIADAAAGDLANESGEIDFYSGTLFVNRAHLKEVKRLQNKGGGSAGVQFITFNCEQGPFADKRVRQAVAYVIDRKDIMTGAFEGYGDAETGFWCPYMWGYQPNVPAEEYNIEKAKQLLAEAGYPNGFKTVYKVLSSPSYSKTAEVVSEQLRKIGIECELRPLEKAAYVEEVQNKCDFTITNGLAYGVVPDVDYIYTKYLSSTNLGNNNNYSRYVNKDLDELIKKARVSQDEAERKALYWEVNRIVAADHPYIPWGVCQNMVFANADLKGFEYDGVERYSVYDWSF